MASYLNNPWKIFLLINVLQMISANFNPLPPISLTHRAVLDLRGYFVMMWNPGKDNITIELQVATRGYVGLGFSPNGGMKGADIVIGWLDEQGNIYLSDRYARGTRTPSIDNSQDYKLLGGYKNSTHTVLRFSRPWITCDHKEDVKLTDDTTKVIWAYNDRVPDPESSTMEPHDYRGIKNLYLKDPNTKLELNRNVNYWDIRSPNIALPDDMRTLYWCKLYKAPSHKEKHHFVGYEPLIEESNLAYVHHMILYECKLSDSKTHYEKWISSKGAQCYGKNMPLSWSACSTPIVAWAVGSDGEMMPKHVGFPIGDEHGGATYFLLEIHYDNPRLRRGVSDSSGLRLYLTKQLRQFEAGILTLGQKVEPTQMIPPKMSQWQTYGHCTSDCTKATLPYNGIKVFSGVLHAHMIGTSISLKHIRGGRELPPIFSDKNYVFNYQQSRTLDYEATILPNDHLITECIYDSTSRINPTFGGFATEDEMCLVFAAYYPRQNISECYSRPDINLLFLNFGILNVYDKEAVMRNFGSDTFEEEYIREIQESYFKRELDEDKNKTLREAKEIHMGMFLKTIMISDPPVLANRTFYNVIMDPSTWTERVKRNFQELVTIKSYEPTCLYHGRRAIKDSNLKTKADFPKFMPFTPFEGRCTEGIDSDFYSYVIPAATPKPTDPPIQFENDEAIQILDAGTAPRDLESLPINPDESINYLPVEENEINQKASLKNAPIPESSATALYLNIPSLICFNILLIIL